MLTIDIDTARRFILGKQGLWPGRRWHGIEGTEQAMRAMEYLQLDPLQIVARSHDITLHSRVLDYTPGLWEDLAYQQRKFFDWGGWLATRPMDELPYWRVVMRRERDSGSRMRAIASDHADAIAEMRAILRERGTVSNRDFAMATRTRTQSYRGRKDSALALYYLWSTGEVMTHHRERFERVYALTEAVAPAHLICERDEAETDRFLIAKEISFNGLARLNRVSDSFLRGVPFGTAKQVREAMLADGEIVEVRVDGWKEPHVALAGDAQVLQDVSAGRVPEAWRPLATSTTEEVVFLAPLDQVSARYVIGADGAWSRVRPLLSTASPEYAGISYVEFHVTDAPTTVPASAALVGTGSLFALSDNKNLGGHGGRDLHLGAMLRAPEDWLETRGVDWSDAAATRTALLAEFADWSRALTDLIRHCDDEIVARRIYALPTGHSWPRIPGVTLVGDAAHLM